MPAPISVAFTLTELQHRQVEQIAARAGAELAERNGEDGDPGLRGPGRVAARVARPDHGRHVAHRPRGLTAWMNEAASELAGRPAADLLGTPISSCLGTPVARTRDDIDGGRTSERWRIPTAPGSGSPLPRASSPTRTGGSPAPSIRSSTPASGGGGRSSCGSGSSDRRPCSSSPSAPPDARASRSWWTRRWRRSRSSSTSSSLRWAASTQTAQRDGRSQFGAGTRRRSASRTVRRRGATPSPPARPRCRRADRGADLVSDYTTQTGVDDDPRLADAGVRCGAIVPFADGHGGIGAHSRRPGAIDAEGIGVMESVALLLTPRWGSGA